MNQWGKWRIFPALVAGIFLGTGLAMFPACHPGAPQLRATGWPGGKVLLRHGKESGGTCGYRLEETLTSVVSGQKKSRRRTEYEIEQTLGEISGDGVVSYRMLMQLIPEKGPRSKSPKYYQLDLEFDRRGNRRGPGSGSEHDPMNDQDIFSWQLFPVFPAKKVRPGSKWSVDVVMGMDAGEHGFLHIYPVRFDYVFAGVAQRGGRECARITYRVEGSVQETGDARSEIRYSRSVSGEGEVFFDPGEGIIVSHRRNAIRTVTSESRCIRPGDEGISWCPVDREITEGGFKMGSGLDF